MTIADYNSLFSLVKTPELFGRYITNFHIEKCLEKLPKSSISVIGQSVEKRPIYSLKFGKGPTKVLLWSQMHGNESTTTKALFDCFRLFDTSTALSNLILESCTLFVIPILNPDGAQRYTRINANHLDLNRDAQDLSQPESKVLRTAYDDFKPHYCFNLHGQRTLYNVGNTNVSATLSFLSPSQDQERQLTPNRKQAMAIIAEIKDLLQIELPNGIARYDDGFNLNCVGDTFQNFGVPTLLYEAGHYPNDYNREVVRRYMFIALLKGLTVISNGVETSGYSKYLAIPENGKKFYDIIIRNVKENGASDKIVDIAFQYVERLCNGKIEFVPVVDSISKLDGFYGHREINAKGCVVAVAKNKVLKVTNEIDFVFINNEKIALKPLNN